MIRTQVRCDKRVSFRDRREGWTCVCPSPGVARTHMATRTVSLRAGNPRQAWTRPSPTAPMRWRVLRSTNAGCNHTGLSGGSRPQHQAATTHKRPMLHTPLRHRRTLGKITKPRHHRRRPTISYIIVTPRSSNLRCGRLAYCTGAAADERTLGPALNRLRGRRLVHQLLRGCLAI